MPALFRIMYGIRGDDSPHLPGKTIYDEVGVENSVQPSTDENALRTLAAEMTANPPANPRGMTPDEFWVEHAR